MKRVELLFLSLEDVVNTGLTLDEAIGSAEEVLIEHGSKMAENPPKPSVHPFDNAFIHAMPAYLPRKKVAGMKWVSGFFNNPKIGLPAVMGLIVLNDVETGQPLAVMDCSYITALRTAAVSAVAVKYLAREDTETIGIVGAGVQGRYHILSLSKVLPGIKTALVFDRNETTLNRLLADINGRAPFPVKAGRSVEDVIRRSDIAITATGLLHDRIFKGEWIKEGALVLPVHSRGWDRDALQIADKFIVDDWQQFNYTLGGSDGYYSPLPKLYAELGEIAAGKKPGRENEKERIIDFNLGLGIQDVFLAEKALERAEKKGIGTRLTLLQSTLPLPE